MPNNEHFVMGNNARLLEDEEYDQILQWDCLPGSPDTMQGPFNAGHPTSLISGYTTNQEDQDPTLWHPSITGWPPEPQTHPALIAQYQHDYHEPASPHRLYQYSNSPNVVYPPHFLNTAPYHVTTPLSNTDFPDALYFTPENSPEPHPYPVTMPLPNTDLHDGLYYTPENSPGPPPYDLHSYYPPEADGHPPQLPFHTDHIENFPEEPSTPPEKFEVATKECINTRSDYCRCEHTIETGEICGKEFKRNAELRRHRETVHTGERSQWCPFCSQPYPFARKDTLRRHVKRTHPELYV
ncbi:hypothetical protein B0T14DRAFT_80329 [Immersiella caudata]|uniref:C2H2-type domain-containing protein n=1 Tax=Immersiella caudata TaxID=314043 RepID=A0AA40CCT9_9PEZI|nr:hypothetical protein B0T14DRAFT_80329 [Immersiella caudata]